MVHLLKFIWALFITLFTFCMESWSVLWRFNFTGFMKPCTVAYFESENPISPYFRLRNDMFLRSSVFKTSFKTYYHFIWNVKTDHDINGAV